MFYASMAEIFSLVWLIVDSFWLLVFNIVLSNPVHYSLITCYFLKNYDPLPSCVYIIYSCQLSTAYLFRITSPRLTLEQIENCLCDLMHVREGGYVLL